MLGNLSMGILGLRAGCLRAWVVVIWITRWLGGRYGMRGYIGSRLIVSFIDG